jgi:hypothetical protein
MGCLAQGITNRAHRCTETEDQRIQNSHSQPHPRFSTCLMRGADKYCPVIAGTCRPQPAPAVSPGWRRPEQFSRPCGCICATRSFQLAVVVSFRSAQLIGSYTSGLILATQRSTNFHHVNPSRFSGRFVIVVTTPKPPERRNATGMYSPPVTRCTGLAGSSRDTLDQTSI